MNHTLTKAPLWRILTILAVIALLAFSGIAGQPVAAQESTGNPHMIVFPEWEGFEGVDWLEGAFVSISVAEKECSIDMESQYGFFSGNFKEGCDLVFGDVVTFTDGFTTVEHTVRTLSVTEANAAVDIVAGKADAGAVVQVWPHDTGELITTTADENGNWSADFTGSKDLVPGTSGRSQITDENGNSTAVDWVVPKPFLIAFPETNSVEAWEFPVGEEVTLTIDNAPGLEWTGTAEVTSWGDPRTFFRFDFGNDYDLLIGDMVTLTSPNVLPISHTVQNLAVMQSDAVQDVIAGKADTGAVVQVWPHETGQQVIATADENGNWSADFTGTFDLVPGTSGRSQITEENGNATGVDWNVPKPYLIAFPDFDAVEAWEFPAGDVVTLTIDNAPGMEWTGTAEVTSWGDPRTFFRFETGSEYDLQFGDVITLSSPNVPLPISLTVQALTVTGMDSVENTISGMADAGVTVDVWVHGQDQYAVHPQADGEGNWTADFDDTSFDLQDGMCGRANLADGNGNSTAVDWCVPYADFRDDFDGPLADGWYWLNENTDQWSLGGGLLRIYANPGGTGSENLLLRDVHLYDFSIETHLFFEPTANFQIAGLVLWMDDGNFLQLGRAFCDVPAGCVGNGIYFDYVAGGGFNGPNFATVVDNPAEAYLRLERRGDMVRGLFSSDGITWFEIGTHWLPPDTFINAVGLTAAQDQPEPDYDMPADFDYFEFIQGRGWLPEGFHDGFQGEVPRWDCNANGWAVDPDNRLANISVEINVDGVKVEEFLPADQYRPDLEESGGCENGTCGFSTDLWGRIPSYETNNVTAYAQDLETGEWVQLLNSPKDLTCRTFDIYTYDTETGETTQITNLRNADEYNPHFSPNGKLVVHHTVFDDGNYGLYITDIKTGISTLLNKGENGGFASFSPNGRWITFSADFNLYQIVSPGTGDPLLIREDAMQADWAPNGKRIVFQQPSDGSIRTMPIDHGKGAETIVVKIEGTTLSNPEWSPDGKWIVYDDGNTIFKIAVNAQGAPVGEPIALTNDPLYEGHSTWSPDGTTIVFHGGMDGSDFDLWSVPADGGETTWLTGVPGAGDYDPGYLMDSEVVGYASISPNGQAPRPWVAAYTYDLPGDTWSEGTHTYKFTTAYGDDTGDRQLNVAGSYPTYEGRVLLRPSQTGVRAWTGGGCEWVEGINPAQATRFMVGWTSVDWMTYPDALSYFVGMNAQVSWDGGMPVDMIQHILLPYYYGGFWPDYVCSFTTGW